MLFLTKIFFSGGSGLLSRRGENKNLEWEWGKEKEIGLEVDVDKTKYMVMYRDQNARGSHNMKTDNSSLEGLEGFK